MTEHDDAGLAEERRQFNARIRELESVLSSCQQERDVKTSAAHIKYLNDRVMLHEANLKLWQQRAEAAERSQAALKEELKACQAERDALHALIHAHAQPTREEKA